MEESGAELDTAIAWWRRREVLQICAEDALLHALMTVNLPRRDAFEAGCPGGEQPKCSVQAQPVNTRGGVEEEYRLAAGVHARFERA